MRLVSRYNAGFVIRGFCKLPRHPPLNAPLKVARPAGKAAAPANDHVYAHDAAAVSAMPRNRGGVEHARPARLHAPRQRDVLRAMPARGASLIAADGWQRGVGEFASTRSPFTYALVASIALHAVVLALHFSGFDFQRLKDRGPALEVALVNAKSASPPAKAEFLAQANLDGGGNTDAPRRAKSPLPVLPRPRPVDDMAVTTQRVEVLERQTRELMTQMQDPAVVATAPPTPAPAAPVERTELPSATALMEKTLEVMRLEAQIAKDMDANQKRPRRKLLGASAEEYRFARYIEDWRQKVERVGNLNYPEAARQLKLYGNLILTVSIRSDGSVENVTVERSSGRKVLDAAAVKIVEMAAPYAPFPKDIVRDTDVLDITRTWTFAKGDELRAE